MEETIIEKLEKQCNRYILKYLVELAQNDYLALRVEGYTDYDLYIHNYRKTVCHEAPIGAMFR
mgnify:CR=1 FL=1